MFVGVGYVARTKAAEVKTALKKAVATHRHRDRIGVVAELNKDVVILVITEFLLMVNGAMPSWATDDVEMPDILQLLEFTDKNLPTDWSVHLTQSAEHIIDARSVLERKGRAALGAVSYNDNQAELALMRQQITNLQKRGNANNGRTANNGAAKRQKVGNGTNPIGSLLADWKKIHPNRCIWGAIGQLQGYEKSEMAKRCTYNATGAQCVLKGRPGAPVRTRYHPMENMGSNQGFMKTMTQAETKQLAELLLKHGMTQSAAM